MKIILPLPMAALLLAIGCGPTVQDARTKSHVSGTDSITTTPGAVRGYQLVMASKTIEGEVLPIREAPVALVVFASWCGHCKKELGELGRLRQKHPNLRIIGVNAYEDFQGISNRDKLKRYIADNAPWLTEIVSADSERLADFGGVPKIPTLFLYDAQGGVVEEYRRNQRPAPTPEELEAAILRATAR